MKTRAEYRQLASDCMCLAQSASTPQERETLLSIADIWQQLADGAAGNQPVKPKSKIMSCTTMLSGETTVDGFDHDLTAHTEGFEG